MNYVSCEISRIIQFCYSMRGKVGSWKKLVRQFKHSSETAQSFQNTEMCSGKLGYKLGTFACLSEQCEWTINVIKHVFYVEKYNSIID